MSMDNGADRNTKNREEKSMFRKSIYSSEDNMLPPW